MNIYKIRQNLEQMNKPVFTTNEITRISRLKKSAAIVSIKRMIDQHLLYRVAKGFYSISDDPFLYATYIIQNSYISFNTSLYLHQVIDQIPTKIFVAVPTRIKKQVPGVVFITMPKQGFQGYTTMQYKGYNIWVADIEKALADLIYKYGRYTALNIKPNTKKINTFLQKLEMKKGCVQ